MSNKQQVFISYSHKDAQWLERLTPFLQPLARKAELRVWSDTDIKPSSLWQADIQKTLNEADAAVLLISQNFLASDYITSNELPQLLSAANQRGVRIFPVFVSSCYLERESPLLMFQGVTSPALPLNKMDDAKQDEIFVNLARSIDEILTMSRVGITEEWLERFRSRFVPVTGGLVIIGDNELNSKLHALKEHEVSVKSFRLGQYVVTQSEWVALMNTRPWLNEKSVRLGDDIPVVNVTWGDALDFIGRINKADSKFNYRLPTEAEWEYAARGGQVTLSGPRTKFSFGDDENKLMEYGWHDQNASLVGDNYPHSAGMLKKNPLQLYDMHGNIWEWTAESDQGSRVVRGGGFNFKAEGASSAFRLTMNPVTKSVALGFRFVQEPE
jgi:formylglycine-generating enzyme required for sulfatase activity